jgi:hypothetical protein
MLKNKKQGKQEDNEDFDDMLAEFLVADLATANKAANPLITSSSSSGARTSARPSEPSPATANLGSAHISEDAIIRVCKAGNLVQLQRWGRQGVRTRTMRPLLRAVSNGTSFEVLKCLVNKLGANINQGDEDGWTALTTAASLGYQNTIYVRYLVEKLGADLNLPGHLGRLPLFVAAAHGHLAVVRVLLTFGADIDRTTEGVTPLMAASTKKHHEIVKWLVKAGADTQTMVEDNPATTAASLSKHVEASSEQTVFLEAKTHCSSPGCNGAGIMKGTGCKLARYCGEACQLAHWKAHKADCRRWSTELLA